MFDSEWRALLGRLKELGAATIACSGGVDSRFLVHAALQAGVRPRLVHIAGPHVPEEDTEFMLSWAGSLGLEVTALPANPLDDAGVRAGNRERCYFCKRFLFGRVRELFPGPVCDGSNASDALSFRPGRKALLELGIISPLAESGITKNAVYTLAERTGLVRPRQLSGSCLLTRFSYGMSPTLADLSRVAAVERAVRSVLDAHAVDAALRLRIVHDGGAELHVETDALGEGIRTDLEKCLERAGFRAEIRCMAGISGYFDRTDSVSRDAFSSTRMT